MPAIYSFIANPYMPNGTPNLTNAPSPPYAPGEIGKRFTDQNTGNTYLRVYLDSGATSATAAGAVKAGQLAYWKDRVNNIVTNDNNFNDTGTPASAVNRVAGIFQTAVTAAPGVNQANGTPQQYYCDLLVSGVEQSLNASVGATVVDGCAVIADGSNFPNAKTVATVTTAPTQQVLGYARQTGITGSVGAGAGTFLADVSIGFID
jgi:hypothetical protein